MSVIYVPPDNTGLQMLFDSMRTMSDRRNKQSQAEQLHKFFTNLGGVLGPSGGAGVSFSPAPTPAETPMERVYQQSRPQTPSPVWGSGAEDRAVGVRDFLSAFNGLDGKYLDSEAAVKAIATLAVVDLGSREDGRKTDLHGLNMQGRREMHANFPDLHPGPLGKVLAGASLVEPAVAAGETSAHRRVGLGERGQEFEEKSLFPFKVRQHEDQMRLANEELGLSREELALRRAALAQRGGGGRGEQHGPGLKEQLTMLGFQALTKLAKGEPLTAEEMAAVPFVSGPGKEVTDLYHWATERGQQNRPTTPPQGGGGFMNWLKGLLD